MSKTNKKWRHDNPKKRRIGRNRYYQRHMYGEPHTRKAYTTEDNTLILTKQLKGKHMFDRDIAKKLERSIKAIQVHRCMLRRGRGYDTGKSIL